MLESMLPPTRVRSAVAAHMRLGSVESALSALDGIWQGFRVCCSVVTPPVADESSRLDAHAASLPEEHADAAEPAAPISLDDAVAAVAPRLASLQPPPVHFIDAITQCIGMLADTPGFSLAAALVARSLVAEFPLLSPVALEIGARHSQDVAAHVASLLEQSGLLASTSDVDPTPTPPSLLGLLRSADSVSALQALEHLVDATSRAGSPVVACAAMLEARKRIDAGAASHTLTPEERQRWSGVLLRLDQLLPRILVRCGLDTAGASDARRELVDAGMSLTAAVAQRISAELTLLDQESMGYWVYPEPRVTADGASVPATRKRVRRSVDWRRFTKYTSPVVLLFRAATAAMAAGHHGLAFAWLGQASWHSVRAKLERGSLLINIYPLLLKFPNFAGIRYLATQVCAS